MCCSPPPLSPPQTLPRMSIPYRVRKETAYQYNAVAGATLPLSPIYSSSFWMSAYFLPYFGGKVIRLLLFKHATGVVWLHNPDPHNGSGTHPARLGSPF